MSAKPIRRVSGNFLLEVSLIQDIYSIPIDYSDSQWQVDYLALKEQNIPSSFSTMPVVSEWVPKHELYHGMTQYQCYCKFINDVLSVIRAGEVDYCYYIYQIIELLKYEPNLKTSWLSEFRCFKVWL